MPRRVFLAVIATIFALTAASEPTIRLRVQTQLSQYATRAAR
jgi:hypothetical protein